MITVITTPLMMVGTWYGMNFRDMPELGWRHGYWVAAGLMILSTAGTYWLLSPEKMALADAPKSSFLDKVLGRIGRLDAEGLQNGCPNGWRGKRSFFETLLTPLRRCSGRG